MDPKLSHHPNPWAAVSAFFSQIFIPRLLPSWQSVPPFLPDPTGNPYQDAKNEYQLLKTLNAPGNARARRDFIKAQSLLKNKLSEKEKDLLKLADFKANESLQFLFRSGMVTAMDMLCDYWPRWFGRKANTKPQFNKEIYWAPWSFFMEDEYISEVKDDLIANLFNEKARNEVYKLLASADKFGDKITDFDFSHEQPLMWDQLSHQQRSVNLNLTDYRNPRFWAMGKFKLSALPAGIVVPLPGGGHRICVSDVYLYVHDTINFAGSAQLGLWDFKNRLFPSLSTHMRLLGNTDFEDFRARHGFGKDFTVLSPLHKLHNFDGKCWEVNYQ